MSFLSKVLIWVIKSPVGQALGALLVEKVFGELRAAIARSKERRRITENAKLSIEDLKNAKTKDEIDQATDKAIDDL